ncbi:7-cyano-7-deazaguanine/7-aminomethyl-7-deazaguanine transporter [Legionella geestiana]|uniref:7-cyano-7-deazaguanine/7-aminomethyl-7- deazaguanine transporter n=1 Tax=Legionella geestiana TaxID=45065 RepID=UPI001092ED78|nr:7-cyano-7-deazaguanine/7-aminomethyl-7-deazaguanine transporter [Legionella geestiana]QDQ40999.1 7-cyano-7-deazaguanine/7-aminomethyl-7-deazaguanine transporter [Legionella geestiana]
MLEVKKKRSRSLWTVSAHIFLIAASNVLVQYPFVIFGLHTTWGAFTYPFIFLLTDLSTRIQGVKYARQTVFQAMVPGLLVSYLAAIMLSAPEWGWQVLSTLKLEPLRIAIACFVAYVFGQLSDILVFSRFKKMRAWWWAPMVSTTLSSALDTFLFFALAFYASSNHFMAEHWPEIALVDMGFKIAMSLVAIVPLYGILAAWVLRRKSMRISQFLNKVLY